MVDATSFVTHDMDFHIAIASIVDNPILVAVSRAMLGWLRQYRAEMLHWSGNENITIAEHVEIVDRIEAGDAAGAEGAMTRHLKRSSEVYVHEEGRVLF
jgi:DNA-binding FadR family transcriptional regulator